MKKIKSNIVKKMAEKNMKPFVGGLVTRVFGKNPNKRDYDDALSFIEDVIKNAKREPNYLKLLGTLALFLERSEFVEKLIPYIFRTVVPASDKSEIYKIGGLEFDHELIMEELEDVAKELRALESKIKD